MAELMDADVKRDTADLKPMAAGIVPEQSAALAAMGPREVFGQVMGQLAENDTRLAVVVSDYGRRLGLDRLREVAPEAFVQCGIAEQNQVEVASALANEGFATFAPGYATFITGRVYDQVRVNLGMMASPVILVGVSCGCESGALGASHMAVEDIALMREVPGLSVYSPADNAEFASLLFSLAARPRPAYVRMNGLDGENLHGGGTSFTFGQAECLWLSPGFETDKVSPRVGIIATGTICSRALAAAHLLEGRGVKTHVLEMATIKPLDTSAIDSLVGEGCQLVVSVEEHSIMGGLGSAVAEHLAEKGAGPALLRLGMPDTYLHADEHQVLLQRAGLDPETIASRILGHLHL